jgi:hypothetical protein
MRCLTPLITILILPSLCAAQTTRPSSLDGATLELKSDGATERYALVPLRDAPTTAPATQATTPPTTPPTTQSTTQPTTSPTTRPIDASSFHIQIHDAVAPAVVSVSALGLDVDPLATQYEWDFGDPNAARRTLRGFVGGHVYERAGTYVITLIVTAESGTVRTLQRTVEVREGSRRVIEVAPDGPDALVTALAGVRDDAHVLLRRGATYDVSKAFVRPGKRIRISATGDPSLPRPVVRYTGSRNGEPMIACSAETVGLSVEGIAFDSVAGASPQATGHANAINAAGRGIAVRDCAFLNVNNAINGNGRPSGVVVADCESKSVDGLRGYFVWLEGTDWTISGNRVANSTRQHVVRGAHWERVNVSYNDLANLSRRGVDAYDIAKTSLNLQRGAGAWVTGNVLRGPTSFGPLGKQDGLKFKDHRSTTYVIERNRFLRSPTELQHGLGGVTMRENAFEVNDASCVRIDGYDSTYGRGVADVRIEGNVGRNAGATGAFLWVDGRVDGITLTHNRYDAPNLTTGAKQSANVVVNDRDLRSFRTISGNTWRSGPGAALLLPVGYLDAKQWTGQRPVTNDAFR